MDTSIQIEEEVFDAVIGIPGNAERRECLERACAGNSALRAKVEALLAAQAKADRFFADCRHEMKAAIGSLPPSKKEQSSAPDDPVLLDESPGSMVGRYRILEKIGEGGCGAVYLAEQQEPVHRKVALKVIKLGMDTRAVIARFEAERQTLALMDHPNIAKVLDAGATRKGRPFFVMELVRGMKITEYCDQNHLDTNQRLELFIQICHAIQHAHQKGIIHRDIKPSNILVTTHDGIAVPKVIDFGIAKATTGQRLSGSTVQTASEQFIGTPAYMSPEQAKAGSTDIDTRSDIYSLGVLLYELLTGKTPFEHQELMSSGLDGMRKTLQEIDPHRPSTRLNSLRTEELTLTAVRRHAEPPKLKLQLRGDLDWIALKALEKDRARRYETANGLATDIQRHLNHEPVRARPPSRAYTFQKLVRRNRGIFAAAGAVTAALVIGLGACTALLIRERELTREAERARAEEAKLRMQAEARERITRAVGMIREDDLEDADAIRKEIVPNHPSLEGASVFRLVGEWHALAGRWSQAADCFRSLLMVDQLDGLDISSCDLLEYGPALIELHDKPGYDSFRTLAMKRFGDVTNAVAAERILKVSLLLPPDDRLMRSLQPIAGTVTKAFTADGGNDEDQNFKAAWGRMSLALLEYRRGHYGLAADWARRCLACTQPNAPREATARIILAMAQWQQGQRSDAVGEFKSGREVIDNVFKNNLNPGSGQQGLWFDWIFGRILLREAGGLMNQPV